jgi:acetyltransferase EpsM
VALSGTGRGETNTGPVRRIAILGGDGVGSIIAGVIAANAASGERIVPLGFLNDVVPAGSQIAGYSVLGGFDDWAQLDADVHFIAAIMHPKAAQARHRRLRSLNIPDERWASVVDRSARIAGGAVVGPGCFIAANAVVETGARVGRWSAVRAGAYVGHHVQLGDFAFVGPNATLLGMSRYADGAHVGANAVCRERVTVGAYALVGIGAVVVKDVAAFTVVAGNPARPLDAELET